MREPFFAWRTVTEAQLACGHELADLAYTETFVNKAQPNTLTPDPTPHGAVDEALRPVLAPSGGKHPNSKLQLQFLQCLESLVVAQAPDNYPHSTPQVQFLHCFMGRVVV